MSKLKHFLTILLLFGITFGGIASLSFYQTPEKVSAAGQTIKTISTMQEMTPEICSNTTVEDGVATLTDTRDGSTYTVAKLNDGKCWMTQNLRLTRESLIAKYKADNSIQSSDDSVVPASAYTLNANTSDIARTNTNFTMPTSGGSSDAGFSSSVYDNPVVAYDKTSESNLKAYGAYYNWNAATAGTGTKDTRPSDTLDSICPKGWRLPTGGSGGDFEQLGKSGNTNRYSSQSAYNGSDSTYSGITGRWFGSTTAGASGAAFFPAAGYYSSGSLSNASSDGYYWSSTVNSSNTNRAYYLGFYSSTVGLADYSNKYFGNSVRCVARSDVRDDQLGDNANVNIIAVKVSPSISIETTSGMKEDVEPYTINTGTISATVRANTLYQVLLSANKTALTIDNKPVSSDIPNIPTSDTIGKDNTSDGTSTNNIYDSGWGIKNSTGTYDLMSTTPTLYHNVEDDPDEGFYGKKHIFTIGVSVSPSLPSGQYSTTVTVTAANI